jgi:hypothetical protein|nr:hypothetical protein [Aphanothece minutissima]
MPEPPEGGVEASGLVRLDQESEKCLGDVETLFKPEARVVGTPELVHPDQLAPGLNDFTIAGIVEANLGRGSHGNLLKAADAGAGTAHIPEMAGITMILKKHLDFNEDLKKGR